MLCWRLLVPRAHAGQVLSCDGCSLTDCVNCVLPAVLCLQAGIGKQQDLLADEAEEESEGDDDDDDEDDDESEDDPVLSQAQGIASLKRTLAVAPLNGKTFDMRDDDDDDEEEVRQLASQHCTQF